MAVKDISCKAFQIIIRGVEEKKLSPEILCDGTPYDLNFIRDVDEYVEWDVYCKIISNTRKIWSSDSDYVNLGIQGLYNWRMFPVISTLAGMLLNAREVYWLNTHPKKGVGAQYFRCIIPTIRDIDEGHLEIKLELPPDYQYCREFFLITKGVFIACPLLLNLNQSKVTMRQTDRGAVYSILYPMNNSIFKTIRRFFSRLFSNRDAIQELNAAYELLYDRYNQLEENREKIELQAKQLETAYSIGQVIKSNLNLDNTLSALTRSLIDVAGFAAVEVLVDIVVDGEPVKRFLESGTIPQDSISIKRNLEGHGQKIGEITLWTDKKVNNENVNQLLDYIIPPISIELLSSVSFKMVNEYRNKLEEKVVERTEQLNKLNDELKYSIEKLEELKVNRDRFYTNISHEFRTPLMLILGPLDELFSKLTDNESIKHARIIQANANRLLNLINQLLDLSSIEAKIIKIKASKGDITKFVESLVNEYESIANKHEISLKLIIEKENIEVYFDREKTEKIITNIMSNAIKFTPPGGRIQIKVSESFQNSVEISIRDSGIGIPPSELAKVFDRFYQVDGSHTRKHEGTGIGLALTKEFVEMHKGQIRIDSVENEWTEVKIYFPLGRTHLTDDEIIQHSEYKFHKVDDIDKLIDSEKVYEETGNEFLEDKTIVLVVEDNPELREYIKVTLKPFYHVIVASDGTEGLKKAEAFIPDLIVSDIMMPSMDGCELTKKIRQDHKTSHIPIILLTAKSDKDSKLEGLDLGADVYLTKPFDTQELLIRIKNLIETRKLLQQKYGDGRVELHRTGNAKLNHLDQQFLCKVLGVIDQHISEEEFSIEEFGKDVGMSRSQIHRKLKALTGKSMSLYLRTVRLAKAKQMIENKKGSISEICYQVGFSSPAYFSRCFKEEFGYTPSEVK